jgi:nicotinate dehydrogenase subunit A
MIELNVNGKTQSVDAAPDTPLLYVLRDHLAMNGAKFGCGLGQCGACTVMVDGDAVFSCLTPVSVLAGRKSKTVEGRGTIENPGPLQRAFIDEQAAQCGYCIAGMIMRPGAAGEESFAVGCRDSPPHDAQPCRCGTQMRIFRAVRRAAQAMQAGRCPRPGPR